MIPIGEDQIIQVYDALVVSRVLFFIPWICMFMVVDAGWACIDADVVMCNSVRHTMPVAAVLLMEW